LEHTTSFSLGRQDLLNAALKDGIWWLDSPFAQLEWRGRPPVGACRAHYNHFFYNAPKHP